MITERAAQMAALRQAIAERDAEMVTLRHAAAERDAQISTLQKLIAERDERLSSVSLGLSAYEREMANLYHVITELGTQIRHLRLVHSEQLADRDNRIMAMEDSTAWKLTYLARRLFVRLPFLGALARCVANAVWWTITFQPAKKLRERNATVKDTLHAPPSALQQLGTDTGHRPPVTDDCCLAVPFDYWVNKPAAWPSIAVICHLFYPSLVEEFRYYLTNIPFSFALFITTDTRRKKEDIEEGFVQWSKGAVEVRLVPNRGRDIAPKLIACRDVYDRYEYVLHIHSKKSPHYDWRLIGWRFYLLETLLGSEEIVASIFAAFEADPELGMIAPQHCEIIRPYVGWGENFKLAEALSFRLGLDIAPDARMDFPSGSMFWARSAALKPLLECNLSWDDFPVEGSQLDGTLAHVIEHLYFFLCEVAGYRWIKIGMPPLLGKSEDIRWVQSRADLRATIEATQRQLIKRGKPRGLIAPRKGNGAKGLPNSQPVS